jgi:hypothetical protein
MDETSDRLEPNIVGYCLDANTGTILWTVDLPGTDPVQTAGIFSDATVFAPISDGEHVWFFNRCGSMGCFDFDGKAVWLREYRPRTRTRTASANPSLSATRSSRWKCATKKPLRNWSDTSRCRKASSRAMCGPTCMRSTKRPAKSAGSKKQAPAVHNTPMAGQLADGRWAVVHGRGGGHDPLEKPYGVSLTCSTPARRSGAAKSRATVPTTRTGTREHVYGSKATTSCSTAATGEMLRTQNLTRRCGLSPMRRPANARQASRSRRQAHAADESDQHRRWATGTIFSRTTSPPSVA